MLEFLIKVHPDPRINIPRMLKTMALLGLVASLSLAETIKTVLPGKN